MKRYEIAILLATFYLLVYLLLFEADAPFWIIGLMFTLSPVPVIWMAYQILKNAVYPGQGLPQGEEFGYEDADKNQLGTF
ncbi:MAG: hypothetical protein MUE71_06500 [Chitinophagaceae bacterium]|jgi:hypothetical protein|nr:hypothetical protein [Chitinophagaceae bacterium]MCU0402942.1 hypothetical protein [Chitinophagaceae bacterium]